MPSFALASLLLAGGCAPSVSLRVLKPASINIPAEIQTVAVIDRSRASNAGQTVLGVLEGGLSGEGIAADNEGRLEAMNAAVAVLSESPRFEVLTPTVTPKEVDSNLFDKPWDYSSVARLCKQYGCDGVIALEAFDSDSRTDNGVIATDDSKYNAESSTHWASRNTRVVTSWRFYDAHADRTLDQLRAHDEANTWQEEALTVKDAMARLPSQQDTIRRMGSASGSSYARRIAPAYIMVRRTYYGGGSDEMKSARNHVRATDWEGATPIWRDLAQSTTDAKLRGKARFNLAVAAEVRGELARAQDLAKKAAVDLHNGKARRYASALEYRLIEQRRLEEQLTPPPQETVAPPREKPVPPPHNAPAPTNSPPANDGGGVHR